MHKGFHVAATRVVTEINAYLSKHNLNHKNTVIWVMGHSRGGGVSNLVAKKMMDKEYKVFAYTFAAPSVVEDKVDDSRYHSIYNIINQDDFVPCLPLSKWGFSLYGKNKRRTLSKKEKGLFKKRVGGGYTGLSKKKLSNLVKEFEKVASTRSECFQYTCKCHSKSGKETGKSITIRSAGTYYTKRDVQDRVNNYYKKKVSKEQWASCKIKIFQELEEWKYSVCQSPMFFLYGLAGAMSNKWTFVFRNYASKYESAKRKIILASSKISHPHYVDSYIILSE